MAITAARDATNELAWRAAVLDELRAIRAALERHTPPALLTRKDRDQLERLLPVLAGLHGSDPFLASELVDESTPAVRLVCQGWAPRELGKLLRRAAGVPVGGHLVERVAREAGATVWRVLEVPAGRENGNVGVGHAPLPPGVE